jgi:3-phenylpropionate/cinnamic acid dioxygenase small subunit
MGDLTEITALVHSYARLLDSGDLDGVAALFEHATWRSAANDTVLRGAAEARTVYDRVHLYGSSPRTKHLITNLTIDVEPGAERASAQCSYTVLQGIVPGEPVQPILSGQYHDRFEKVEGTWRFVDRLFVVDLAGDLSRHFV